MASTKKPSPGIAFPAPEIYACYKAIHLRVRDLQLQYGHHYALDGLLAYLAGRAAQQEQPAEALEEIISRTKDYWTEFRQAIVDYRKEIRDGVESVPSVDPKGIGAVETAAGDEEQAEDLALDEASSKAPK